MINASSPFARVTHGSDIGVRTRNMGVIVVVIALAWLLVAVAAAFVVGGGIRIADRHAPVVDHLAGLPADLTVDDVLGRRAPQPTVH
ncbi:MAG: hypothetical protein JWQ26_1479 [Modestobacter sp.]|jgi:hypothetical protein|nr:hypothetical protein [Modestobacter sp.]